MNETPDSDIIGKAKTELRDLLVIVAPNLTPMDTLSGLISQINNVLAWLRDQIPKTTNEGRALPAEPFIMRLGMNFTITPKNVILWPKEKATGRSALGVFEDAIAALLQPSTPPAELAALRAECEQYKSWEQARYDGAQHARMGGKIEDCPYGPMKSTSELRDSTKMGLWQQGFDLVTLRAQLTAAVTRAERAEGALAFYACPATWEGTIELESVHAGLPTGSPAMRDGGDVAREALAAARGAKGEA
jgi:hypothetical protein